MTNNAAPTANAGVAQTVASGAGVTLDGTGSTDPEGQTLTYSWSQTGGTSVTLSNTGAVQPTFATPVVQIFSLTVNDGVQDSLAADSVTITVTAPLDVTVRTGFPAAGPPTFSR